MLSTVTQIPRVPPHEADGASVLASLKQCGVLKDVVKGRAIHAAAMESGDIANVYVANTLISMYVKCSRLDEARKVFMAMQQRNIVSWNALIFGHAENGHAEAALKLFSRIRGCDPNYLTFVAALKACTKLAMREKAEATGLKRKALEAGRGVHEAAVKGGCDLHPKVANAAIDMYAKCGSMSEAREVFNKLQKPDAVAWTSLILGYADNGDSCEALELFSRMKQRKCSPDALTYVAAIKACILDGKEMSLTSGIEIHYEAMQGGCAEHSYLAVTLMDLYTRCGFMQRAHRIFEGMKTRDVVPWTCLMLGYAESGQGAKALELFFQMKQEGIAPNMFTFHAAFKACSNMLGEAALHFGKRIHSEAASTSPNFLDFVGNTLIEMYAKCGSMLEARQVFDAVPEPDVVSWTSLITGYTEQEQPDEALEVYSCMECKPDALAFVAALKACAANLNKAAGLAKGKEVHSDIVKASFMGNAYVVNTLVDMYAKCGSMVDAQKVFDGISDPDVVAWNSLMSGYAANNEEGKALDMFSRLEGVRDAQSYVAASKACTGLAVKEEGRQIGGKFVKVKALTKGRAVHSEAVDDGLELNIYVASTLIDMYAKCGVMQEARDVFERMHNPTVVSWTALIMGYAENGEGKASLDLFYRMRDEGYAPDAHTFIAAFKACGALGALELGKVLHSDSASRGFRKETMLLLSSLVDVYGKCGSMDDAQRAFDAVPDKGLVAWTSLMAGYGRIGDTGMVFELFRRMQEQKLQPDAVTFTCILTACSHAGLADKGKEYFHAMSSRYGIAPDLGHYHCLLDILGRANELDAAVELVDSMPFEPDALTWKTILGACWKWKNVELGKLAFERLVRLDNRDPAGYVLMGNIYGSRGLHKERNKIEAMRMGIGSRSAVGEQSWWASEAGELHTFCGQGGSSAAPAEVKEKLRLVLRSINQQYVDPD